MTNDETTLSATAIRELSADLHRIGAVRFGTFTLKDGRESPFYLDLRILVSHPTTLARVGRALARRARDLEFDRIAGLPYAGLPIAVAMSLVAELPIVYPRKEAKDYGTKKAVEGEFEAGETALIVDDVITSGGAKVEAVEVLRGAGLVVRDVLVVVDRTARGSDALEAAGLRLHSVIRVEPLMASLREQGVIGDSEYERVLAFLEPAQ